MVFHRAGDGRGKEHEDKQQRKGKSVGIHLGMRQRDVFLRSEATRLGDSVE